MDRRARSSNASQPGVCAKSGSPYGSSPAGPPMLHCSPYSPATVPTPLSGRRKPSGGTGGFPGTLTAGLGFSPGLYTPGSAPATTGGMRTPATAATMGSPAPGPRYTLLWKFLPPPRSPLSGLAAPPTPRDVGKKDD